MIALVTIVIRMLIHKYSFMDSLGSPYGILSLICFPIADVFAIYADKKRKQQKK